MKKYWRGLDDLALKPENHESQDYQGILSEMGDDVSRRRFLTLMGASMAMAGFAGCRRPLEHIVPYVKAPEEIIPGVANYYATTMPFGIDAFGLIVESHEGRPTKIEGNPDHPSTLGRSNPFIQASILALYDPDRSKSVMKERVESTWADFISYWRDLMPALQASGGTGLAVLSEQFSSPTLARLKELFLKTYPQAKWVTCEPISDENIYNGIKIATGKAYQPTYHFDKARVILSLDSDFLYSESDSIRNAKGFADGRRVKSETDDMNRLYVAESCFSLTGAMADHRLAIPSSQIGAFTAELAKELARQGLVFAQANLPQFSGGLYDINWLRIVASDLLKFKGQSIVIAGRTQPPEEQALVLAINSALGNIGNTISYRETADTSYSKLSDLSALCADMRKGEISNLIMLGGNPVYDAPVDYDFSEALKNVTHTIHLSRDYNETSHLSEWHLPQAHYLEAWGDARSIDGTPSIIQPMIAPLFGGRSSFEVAAFLFSGQENSGYNIIQETWKSILIGPNFESDWRRVLNDGLFKGESAVSVNPTINYSAIFKTAAVLFSAPPIFDSNLEINFRPSSTIYDGRFANNAWLQELPDPLTKLTWDNAALMSPNTARNLLLSNGDMISLDCRGQKLEMPVWIMPGQAGHTISLPLGYGRKAAGQVGNDVGFDTYILRTSAAPYFDGNLKISKTGETYLLATTQTQGSMVGRPIVREATLEYYKEHPNFAPDEVETKDPHSLWKEHQFDKGNQWGMAIDLNVCIGCGACTMACQSENNIPIVGKEQVSKNRWMHWIRVDRYFSGKANNPEIVYQPVPCMHCETAPCEQVCPVNATVHDHEGLNLQVYNRCIGTRYCSNNCPYKVRRFNFFNYTSKTAETVKMVMNPNVTVRGRGVMEKCTYCLQRIKKGEIAAKGENRDVRDGEVIAACSQACPTNAIVFGLISDPKSKVTETKKQNRNYGMLTEYNTRPRTTYLARLRNPHPELAALEQKTKDLE
jgi:MoCo/4Fe-4S cofactor protein with predicted Tat translocation signal